MSESAALISEGADPPCADRRVLSAVEELPAEERASVLTALDAADDHVCQLGILRRVSRRSVGVVRRADADRTDRPAGETAGRGRWCVGGGVGGFAETQRAEQVAAGVRKRDLGRGISEQVAFARRVSPSAAGRALGKALAFRDRLPETLGQLRAGNISLAQATTVATRTSHLSEENVALADVGLAPLLPGWNPKQTD